MAQPVAVELHGGGLPDEINAGLGVIVAVVVLGLVDGDLAGEVAAVLPVSYKTLTLPTKRIE